MKRRILSFFIVLFLILTQVITGNGYNVRAAAASFSVQVVVESNEGVLVSDTSNRANGYEALQDVLSRHDFSVQSSSSANGKFITGIKDLTTGKEINGTKSSYWLYAVSRGGNYANADVSIDNFDLKNGDRLIVYFAGSNTLLANKIEYSTKSPDKPMTIKLSSQSSWDPAPQQINGVTAQIDGISREVAGNEIKLPEGLSEGKHTLKVSDYKSSGLSNVVADSFDFYMDYPTISVRVEGLNGTIVKDSAKGPDVMNIVCKILKGHNIPYKLDSSSSYITSINNLNAGDLGGWSGWMYYVKSPNSIISPMDGMTKYIPDTGDDVVVYYGDNTPYVTSIKFTPEIVKEKQPFKMKFIYNSYDFTTNKYVDTPIANAIVNIDDYNYITSADGEINVQGLALGKHTYKISGYNINKLPTVVMDKGVFNIDNTNPPGLNYSDNSYNDIYNSDNNKIVKDIDGGIHDVSTYVKNNIPSMWAELSLDKLGIRTNGSYFDEDAADIKEYGIKNLTNAELEKLIICLTSYGYTPYDFAGCNLVRELFNRDIKSFLLNDSAFGLFAMDYANISDGDYRITKKMLVDSLLDKTISYKQNNSDITGWNLFGDKVDPDTTGAVINALSPFYSSDIRVKDTVDKAVKSLSVLQNESGYIPNAYGYNSESLSFTILGLASVGINPEGVMFTKVKGDLVSALLSFKCANGGFRHSLDGKCDSIASEEVLRALIALKQYRASGKYDFYSSTIDAAKLPVYQYKKGTTGHSSIQPKSGNKTANANESGKTDTSTAVRNSNIISKGTGTSNKNPGENDLNNNLKDIIRQIESAINGSDIQVASVDNGIVDKSIFKAIKGLDKYITFDMDNVYWTFYGKDIASDDKSINISLNNIPKYRDEILKKYKNDGIFIISFMDNGTLPGKAAIKIKIDEGWLEGKNKNNLYLYYFNPETQKAEKLEGPLSADSKGFVEIHLTHCSDYFLTDKSTLRNMPNKTSLWNGSTICAIILILAGTGALLFLIKRKGSIKKAS